MQPDDDYHQEEAPEEEAPEEEVPEEEAQEEDNPKTQTLPNNPYLPLKTSK